jgi:hypothetical protein
MPPGTANTRLGTGMRMGTAATDASVSWELSGPEDDFQ